MDEQDFFKIIGVIVFGMFVIYYVVKFFQLQTSLIEGLEAAPAATVPVIPGAASGAAAYAEAIKALTVKMKDELLVDQYRTDYENVVIALDDYCDIMMLKTIVNVKLNSSNSDCAFLLTQAVMTINGYKSGRSALNDVMTFIDKQSASASASSASASASSATSSFF